MTGTSISLFYADFRLFFAVNYLANQPLKWAQPEGINPERISRNYARQSRIIVCCSARSLLDRARRPHPVHHRRAHLALQPL
jgi:hypothetical protein